MISKILSFAEFLFESEDSKIYTIPGDPYTYKMINGSWFTKGPKVPSWKSLSMNNKAVDVLNKSFPDALSSKSTGNKTINLSAASVASTPSSKSQTASKSTGVVYAGSGSGPESWSSIKSKQVIDELNYLQKQDLLSNQKFTILDDRNGSVYCFNPGYSFYRAYPVITGAQSGDSLTTKSIIQFIKANPGEVIDAFKRAFDANPTSMTWKNFSQSLNPFSSTGPGPTSLGTIGIMDYLDRKKGKDEMGFIDKFTKHLDDSYFNHEFKIKQTPSGIFKRAGNVSNYLNDKLLTGIAEKTYGKRYITWETLDGTTIAYGFHGTGNEERIKRLVATEQSLKSPARKMSFGCINFSEPDIISIDKFIGPGQITIWLPDTTSDIVRFPPEEISKYKGRGKLVDPLTLVTSLDQKTQDRYNPKSVQTGQKKMTPEEQDAFDKSFIKQFKNLKKS